MKKLSIISKKVEIEYESPKDLGELGLAPRAIKTKIITISFFGIPVYRENITNKL
jgi:hypothetical protein